MTGEQKSSAHAHFPPQNVSAFKLFFFDNIKRSIPTLFSYDFTIGTFILGVMLTRLGNGESAPATTTMLNTVGFFQFTGILACSFSLGRLFGELEEIKKRTPDKLFNDEIIHLKRKIGRTPKNGVIAGLICAPIIFAMIFADPVLKALGQDETIAETAQTFFRAYTPFFLAFLLRLSMEFVLLATKKQVAVMLIADSVLLITIALLYGLAFKTSLVISGLGLGLGLGLVLAALSITAYVAYHFKEYNFLKNFFSWESDDCEQICDFIKTGIPIILTGVSDILILFAVSIMAGLLPGNVLKMQDVATQYLNFNTLMIAAGSQTTALIVSEQMGKAKAGGASYRSVEVAAKAGIAANVVLQLPLMFFVTVFSDTFSDLIGASVDASSTRNLLLITVAYALVDGIRYNLLQTTRSLGDNAIPSIASSFLLWASVGAAYLLSQHTRLEILGLPTGIAIGALLGTLVLFRRLPHSINFAIENHAKRDNFQDKASCCFRLFSSKKTPSDISYVAMAEYESRIPVTVLAS